jgi:hypothetical protein
MSVTMHLKTANGYYAQAINGGGGEVTAKGPWPREWETSPCGASPVTGRT